MSITRHISERTEGPTPNGGAYAIAYWLDARGNPCGKAVAVAAEIIEYDATGSQVFRSYMQLHSSSAQSPF